MRTFYYTLPSMFIASMFIFGALFLPASAQIGSQHSGNIETIKALTPDGSTWVYVTATDPMVNERMSIVVDFRTSKGWIMEDVDYDIMAYQDGKIILDKKMANSNIGNSALLSAPLSSGNSVEITISLTDGNSVKITKTLNDYSPDFPYKFPDGADVEVKTVPEFGSIVIMIFVVSIMSIIGISRKLHTF